MSYAFHLKNPELYSFRWPSYVALWWVQWQLLCNCVICASKIDSCDPPAREKAICAFRSSDYCIFKFQEINIAKSESFISH